MNALQELLFPPTSTWHPPAEYPDLSRESVLGFDLETYDPGLKTHGPGDRRNDGRVVGVSLATSGGDRWYFPISHTGGGNLSPTATRLFLADLFRDGCARTGGARRLFVGANLGYDLGWLEAYGVSPAWEKCAWYDIQVAEGLIDEERDGGYSLNRLAQDYLGSNKDEFALRSAADAYGLDSKNDLHLLHAAHVGPYAEADAYLPIKIMEKQTRIIHEQSLQDIVALEMDVLPIIHQMRMQGIPVDRNASKVLSAEFLEAEERLQKQLRERTGCDVNVWANESLQAMCKRHAWDYPTTALGNPSFTKDFLQSSKNPVFQLISEIRNVNKLRRDFLDAWFKNEINGYIYPVWHQLKSDDGGTRTGRMAASNPNPQQVPSRSSLGKRIRSLFVRSDGGYWAKCDYSQQEPRLLCHYGALTELEGVSGVLKAYRDSENADIYQILAEAAGIDRTTSKTLTLARMYGQGAESLAARLNVPVGEARVIQGRFDDKVPFVSQLNRDVEGMAKSRGWIRTFAGRRRHFDHWEPQWAHEFRTKSRQELKAQRSLEKAAEVWPKDKLVRAFTYKALNSLIQGSAADMTKIAMFKIYKEMGRVPYMQVHDELNYPVDSEKQAEEIREVMQTCVKLMVPVVADLDYGKGWK